MEFAGYDPGAFRKKESAKAPAVDRLVIGNPLIMQETVRHVPDAGWYVPVTILLDERADGVHLSYHRMASLIGSYGSSQALEVAKERDTKGKGLLTEAAQ